MRLAGGGASGGSSRPDAMATGFMPFPGADSILSGASGAVSALSHGGESGAGSNGGGAATVAAKTSSEGFAPMSFRLMDWAFSGSCGAAWRAWSSGAAGASGPGPHRPARPGPRHFRARIPSFQALAAPFPADLRAARQAGRRLAPAIAPCSRILNVGTNLEHKAHIVNKNQRHGPGVKLTEREEGLSNQRLPTDRRCRQWVE
jgi:hypothetical protein